MIKKAVSLRSEKSSDFGQCPRLGSTPTRKEAVEGYDRDADVLGDSMVCLVGSCKILAELAQRRFWSRSLIDQRTSVNRSGAAP
jgi:hypothetical protein